MIHVGIVGTSMISGLLIEAFHQVEGIHPLAIYSRSLEKAKGFQLEKAYDNYNEMLSDDEIDLIYIASPNRMHYDHAVAALNAKKHVLCEKPFVDSYSEAFKLFQLAREKERMIFEAAMTMYLPIVKDLKKSLSDIGPIHLATLNFTQFSSRYKDLLEGHITNIFNPAFSGGALGDLNVYNIHLAELLFGPPQKVHYYPVKYDNGVDTSGTLVLTYGGMMAILSACKDSYGKSYVHIQGEKGYLYSEEKSSMITSFYHSMEDKVYGQEKEAKYIHEVGSVVRIIKEQDYQEYERLQNHSLEVMKIYEEARRQMGEKR